MSSVFYMFPVTRVPQKKDRQVLFPVALEAHVSCLGLLCVGVTMCEVDYGPSTVSFVKQLGVFRTVQHR